MGLKSYKPTSPGRRLMSVSDFADISKKRPEKKLTRALRRTGGRNAHGHITTRHIGGGHKRRYRVIDWRRGKDGVPAKVVAIEYDPNRTARIALLHYKDGEKRYILAPVGVAVGDVLVSGEAVDIRPGNTLPIRDMPLGTVIHGARAAAGVRRQAHPLRRVLRPADGEGGRLRPGPHALGRGAPGPAGLPRHQSASSRTSRTPASASARPARAAGSASAPRSAVSP